MSIAWADDIYRSDNGRSILEALTSASPSPDDARAIRFDCLRLAIGLGVAKNTDELIACARALYAFVSGDQVETARWSPITEAGAVAEAMRAMSVTGNDATEPTGDDRVLEWLELPTRAWNCLKDGGYRTIGDVRRASDKELLALNNLGRHTLAEIRKAIFFSDKRAS